MKSINIGWLYPELMSTYGDRGNVMVLANRARWRGIGVKIIHINPKTSSSDLAGCDLIFAGGAQDRQQTIVIKDLLPRRNLFKSLFDRDIPGLFVCGAPQLLGHSYITGDNAKLPGLGIFDMETRHFGKNKPRCIGNLVCQLTGEFIGRLRELIPPESVKPTIIGFENHGGRTYLGSGVAPLAEVLSGYGNNGEDLTEGAVYRNCLATYSHGPFLSKNPHISDWLLATALKVKYGKKIILSPLSDDPEWQAHNSLVTRFTR